MSCKGGNPLIVKHRFKKGDKRAAECALLAAEAKRKKRSIFASVRDYSEVIMPEEKIPEGVYKFWELRNVEKSNITAMMVDLTPILNNALKEGDFDTYYKVMEMLGLTFNSTKEQNLKVAFENPLQAEVNGELKIEIVEKKPEPIDGVK